jgi:GNAT superfamily N-acetyltransferase
MPSVDVVRTYLELTSRTQLVPCESPDPRARVETVLDSPASFFRYLYREVGRGHGWFDRLAWSDEQLRQRLAQPGVSLHLLTVAAAPAGYFELERHADDSTEIAYMGLLAEFRGRGLGAFLLCEAVREAWATGTSRVWLHTCTLDSPAALPNYLARGFRPFKEERYVAETQAPSHG